METVSKPAKTRLRPSKSVPAPPRPPTVQTSIARQVRRRPSWILFGALLTLGGALAAVVAVSSTGARRSVLVIASDIQSGDTIEVGDLRTVVLTDEPSIETVDASMAREMAGRVAVAPLVEGTVLSEGLLGDHTVIAEGESVVSVVFRPGAVPDRDLRYGARVMALEVSDPGRNDRDEPLARALGTVHAISVVKNGDVHVSLRVSLADTAAITDASARDRLRLVVVSPTATLDQLAPQPVQEQSP